MSRLNDITIYADPKAMKLHTVQGDLIAIKIGEMGYHPIFTKATADDLNADDVTPAIIESAVGASICGWDAPIGKPAIDYARRKLGMEIESLPNEAPSKYETAAHTQLYKDTLCSCVEGGSGYWLAIDTADRDANGDYVALHGCEDAEDGTKFQTPDVDLGTIRIGMERIAENPKLCRKDIRMAVLYALNTPEDADLDAEAADCILQAGMFNEIVYG